MVRPAIPSGVGARMRVARLPGGAELFGQALVALRLIRHRPAKDRC